MANFEDMSILFANNVEEHENHNIYIMKGRLAIQTI
jgi:hypothetical protein